MEKYFWHIKKNGHYEKNSKGEKMKKSKLFKIAKTKHDDNATLKRQEELRVAISNYDYVLVEKLLRDGLNPNFKYSKFYQETPLIHAIEIHQLLIALCLMDHGADPNLTDNYKGGNRNAFDVANLSPFKDKFLAILKIKGGNK